MDYTQAKFRAEILKALSHPVRVLIVDALSKKDRCVCELHERLPVAQSNVSRHLGFLKRAGVVIDYRKGSRVFYRLQTPCILRAFECAVEVVRTVGKAREREEKWAWTRGAR